MPVLMHDTAKAIDAYLQLVKVNPDDTDAEFALAKLYEDANNYSESQEVSWQSLGLRSEICRRTAGQRQAIKVKAAHSQSRARPSEQSVEPCHPSSITRKKRARSCTALGMPYQQLNKPEDALRNFQQALRFAEDWRSAWHRHQPAPDGPDPGRHGQFHRLPSPVGQKRLRWIARLGIRTGSFKI